MTKLKVLKNNDNLTINGPEVKAVIEKNLSGSFTDLKEITTIFMNDVDTKHASNKSTFHILFGATPGTMGGQVLVDEILGLPSLNACKLEFEDDGYAVQKFDSEIYFSDKHNEVYVAYDLTGLEPDEITAIVDKVTQLVRTEIIDEMVNVDSWVRTKDKDKLHERINTYLRKDIDKKIRARKSDLEEAHSKVEYHKREMLGYIKKISPLMREVEMLENGNVEGIDTFLAGLDLIVNHERVSNLIVKENNVEIHVKNVIATVRIDRVDRHFYMGDMVIKINTNDSEVRFSGTECHKSYWSSRDPHPHVAESGTPCLGNITTTVTELCAQLEIYPLFLICMDFLQTVNLDDPAGRNVYNWTEVQADGSPLVVEEVEEVEVDFEPEVVQVLMNKEGLFSIMTEDKAKEIATYIAYPQYIGYASNEELEAIEAYLSEGGQV